MLAFNKKLKLSQPQLNRLHDTAASILLICNGEGERTSSTTQQTVATVSVVEDVGDSTATKKHEHKGPEVENEKTKGKEEEEKSAKDSGGYEELTEGSNGEGNCKVGIGTGEGEGATSTTAAEASTVQDPIDCPIAMFFDCKVQVTLLCPKCRSVTAVEELYRDFSLETRLPPK